MNLDEFYEELKIIHKEIYPEWRFGQLFTNFSNWLLHKKQLDIFMMEEKEIIKYLKKYASKK